MKKPEELGLVFHLFNSSRSMRRRLCRCIRLLWHLAASLSATLSTYYGEYFHVVPIQSTNFKNASSTIHTIIIIRFEE